MESGAEVRVWNIVSRRKKFYSRCHCKTHSISIKTAVLLHLILCNVLVVAVQFLCVMEKYFFWLAIFSFLRGSSQIDNLEFFLKRNKKTINSSTQSTPQQHIKSSLNNLTTGKRRKMKNGAKHKTKVFAWRMAKWKSRKSIKWKKRQREQK